MAPRRSLSITEIRRRTNVKLTSRPCMARVFKLRVNLVQSSLCLNVEELHDDSGPQFGGKVVVANDNIALIDVNRHGNGTLIHDTPLNKWSIRRFTGEELR